jgi:hypothetical protein
MAVVIVCVAACVALCVVRAVFTGTDVAMLDYKWVCVGVCFYERVCVCGSVLFTRHAMGDHLMDRIVTLVTESLQQRGINVQPLSLTNLDSVVDVVCHLSVFLRVCVCVSVCLFVLNGSGLGWVDGLGLVCSVLVCFVLFCSVLFCFVSFF